MGITKHKPEEYVWILRWGLMLLSGQSYIRHQQQMAAENGAPLGAIYRKHSEETGEPLNEWATIEGVTNRETWLYMRRRYQDCPKEWEKLEEEAKRGYAGGEEQERGRKS